MVKQVPPVRIIVPDEFIVAITPTTHNPTFHQVEGLFADRNVTVGDLKDC
jgi:phenylalanyl-tRNA synthetase alpha chain